MWCKSTSRLALACLPLLLCATLARAQAQQDPPYKVTYDNGVTLEVIAVSIPPTRHKPFWNPAGTKLLDRPYTAREVSHPQLGAELIGYEVVVRVSGLKEKPLYLRHQAAPEFPIYSSSAPYANGKQADDLRVFQFTAPRQSELMEFEIGIAANKWQLVRAFSDPGINGEGLSKVEVLEPSESQRVSKKNMHYFIHLAPTEDALRVVAIDKAGAKHLSAGSWGMRPQEHSLEAVFPDLAKDKVKEYRIERAAYEWKSLKAIHLRPPRDLATLVKEQETNRIMAQEARFDPARDQAQVEDAIEKVSRTRAFEDADTWVGALRDLAEIGPPAIPSIVAELQQTSRPYARSSLAIALRAMDDPRSVSGLIEALASCPFGPNDYGGGTTKDPALLHFMLDIERGTPYRDERGPTFSLGRPVNEITEALESLADHTEGNQHQRNKEDRQLYEAAAARWRNWWEKNKVEKLQNLPRLRTGTRNEWGPLHLAIADNRRDEAQKLIAGGANVSSAGYGGWTSLHLACAMQQLEIVKLLLDKGADIKARTIDGCTPLHAAAGLGPAPVYTPLPRPDVKLINLLIEKGVDVKATDRRGKTALHGAVASGDLAVVELLMDVGIPVEATDARGRTALHRAVECGDEKIVDALLAAGANVNAKDADGRTPIRFASYSLYYFDFNPPTVAKLLAKGAEVDLPTTIALGTVEQVATAVKRNPAAVNEKAKTDSQETPVHWAIRRKSPEMLKILLDAGADPSAKDRTGNTPLHIAVFAADKQVLAMLIAAKADVNAEGNATPLYWACSNLNVEIVDQLLAAGASANLANKTGFTPLSAAFSGTRDNDQFRPPNPQPKVDRAKAIVKALLAHQADPNAKLISERYPLIFFAPLELMDLLLEHGAKLDVTNDNGDTMLHYVAVLSRDELIPYLLQHDVPLEAKNKKGETALHRAVNYLEPRGQTLKLLLDAGADLKARDNKGNTPLHGAVQQGSIKSVTALLEKGADIEAKDNDGATPLHHAAKAGREPLILLLLKRGAIVDATDAAGKAPLQWATNAKIRKLLIDQGAVEPPAK